MVKLVLKDRQRLKALLYSYLICIILLCSQIFREEVDFFIRKRVAEETMKDHELRGLYPPRFQVFFVSSPADPTLQGGQIRFKGAESDLVYDIYLNPPATTLASTTTSTTMTHLAATSKIKLWELLYVEFIKNVITAPPPVLVKSQSLGMGSVPHLLYIKFINLFLQHHHLSLWKASH